MPGNKVAACSYIYLYGRNHELRPARYFSRSVHDGATQRSIFPGGVGADISVSASLSY